MAFVAQTPQGCSDYYGYTPRSDFLFSFATCPRVNIEIASHPNGHDRYRMLPQAGLLVLIVNTKVTKEESFVAIAIYITKQYTAE